MSKKRLYSTSSEEAYDHCMGRIFSSRYSKREYIAKLKNIHATVRSLEESLKVSRSLEAEQWLRHSTLKTKSRVMIEDLKKANKRNKNMLNLFRQTVTDIHVGIEIPLPESLKREVQRTWHQKYDVLLTQNEQLKKKITFADSRIEEKVKQIDDLQQRVLNLAEKLVERNEAIQNICTKYLNLKKRKDEQEVLLKGSIETLQGDLQKANSSATKKTSKMSLFPSKDSLLLRESRRSDRLAHENSLLRLLLQEAKRGCKVTRS